MTINLLQSYQIFKDYESAIRQEYQKYFKELHDKMKIYKLYIKQLESILKEKSDHWFIQKQVLLRELLGLDIDISEFKLDQIIDILDV